MAELVIAIKAQNQAQAALNSVSSSISQIAAQAKNLSAQMKQMGNSLKNVGGKMTLGVTAPILGFAGAAIKAAAAQEQLQVSFTTMLGSADKAKTLLAELSQFAAATPFESPEIQDAAKQLLAFGVAANDIIPTLTNLGDISAGLNIPIGDMAYLFGTAKAQGRLFMADINQLSSRGVPIIEALARTMGVATTDIRKMVEAGKIGFPEMQAALQSLTAEGGQFSGLMAAQSQTLTGLFSTLKDNIGLTLTAIGQQIITTFDLKTKLAGAIEVIGKIKDAILELAKTNPELFKLGIIIAAAAAALGPLLIGLGVLATGLAAAAPAVAALGAALALLVSPLGFVAAGIAALFYFDVGGIGTKFDALTAAAGRFVASIDISAAVETLKANLAELKTALGEIAGGDTSAISGAATGAGNLFVGLKNFVLGQLKSIDWSTLASGAAGDAGNMFDGVKGFVVLQLATLDWSTIGGIGKGATDFFAPLKGWVAEQLAGIDWAALPGDTLTTLQTGATTLKDNIIAAITTFDFAVDPETTAKLSTTLDSVKPIFDKIFGPEGIVTTVNATINESMIALGERMEKVDGKAVGEQFSTMLGGFLSVFTMFEGMKIEGSAERANAIIQLGTDVTNFLADFGSGIDAEALATSLSGFATTFTTQLTTVFGNEENMTAIGAAAGSLASTIITKIGDFFGTAGVGEEMGAAAGGAAGALATGAMRIVTGLATELGKVDWAQVADSMRSFVQGFAQGAATAVGEVDWGPVGQAMAVAVGKAVTGAVGGMFPGGIFGKGMLDPLAGTAVSDRLRGTQQLAAINWADIIPKLTWESFIGSVVWSSFVNPITWGSFVASLTWTSFVPRINWSSWIPDISWGSFIPDIDWSMFLPSLGSAPDAVPAAAVGTSNFRGGLTWVGETGPEMVRLPRGSRIWSNAESEAMMGGETTVIHVENMNVRSDADIHALAYQIDDLRRRRQPRR